ncbi:hypothetical protein Tco_0918709 [Tanacetum coccineum]
MNPVPPQVLFDKGLFDALRNDSRLKNATRELSSANHKEKPHIKCISGKSTSLDRMRPLKLKSCGECSTRRMLTMLLYYKTISMRNQINLHTIHDDTLFGTLKFFSKTEDYQKYGALIPEEMINQAIKGSKAYKTYLDFVTGKATPKKARKFKKIASPSHKLTTFLEEEPAKKPKQAKKPEPIKQAETAKKTALAKKSSTMQTAGVVIRDTPSVFVSKKKAQAKVDRGKGIDLLSDVALLEAAQLKKVLKRSKQDTHMLYVSGSDYRVGSQPKVPDELQDKTTGINEGTNTIPGVLDVPKDQSESENESWGESGDDDDSHDDDNEMTVMMMMRKSMKGSMKLYGDVNVSLTDAEPNDKDKGDKEMTNDDTKDVEHENVIQESAGNQFKYDAQATQNIEGLISSSSISSNYAAKYLNFDNIPPVDTEVVFMLDVVVQHEFPRTSPLLSIHVFVIPKHNVINPPETVTTASTTTISSLLSSLFPHLQQLTPIPTPTTIEATTSTTVVPDSETLSAFHQKITDLEKDVKELKTVDHSSTLLLTIKSEVPKAVKEYLRTSLDDALHKVLQKHFADITNEHSVLAEIVKRLRQQYVPKDSTKDIRKIKMEHAR